MLYLQRILFFQENGVVVAVVFERKHKQPQNKQKTNACQRLTVYLFTIPITLTHVTKAL